MSPGFVVVFFCFVLKVVLPDHEKVRGIDTPSSNLCRRCFYGLPIFFFFFLSGYETVLNEVDFLSLTNENVKSLQCVSSVCHSNLNNVDFF